MPHEVIKKCYIVWYWDSKDKKYRIGQTFKTQKEAEKFADILPHWKYISQTFSVEIICYDD